MLGLRGLGHDRWPARSGPAVRFLQHVFAPGLRASDCVAGDRTHPQGIHAVVAARAFGQEDGLLLAFEPAVSRQMPAQVVRDRRRKVRQLRSNRGAGAVQARFALRLLDILVAHDVEPQQVVRLSSECESAYPTLPDNVLCAGFRRGGVDTCQGDSGGPLFTDTHLVGITSCGHGCGRKGLYGVFTSVAAFHPWILAQ